MLYTNILIFWMGKSRYLMLIEDDGVDTTGMRDNYEPWTETERQLGMKATVLLRAIELSFEKLQKALKNFGTTNGVENLAQLDKTAQVVRTVSPALDDLVCDLYHPVDFPVALQSAQALVNHLHKLLSVAESCHYAEGISKNVVSVLIRLINSSHEDIKHTIANPIPELGNLTL